MPTPTATPTPQTIARLKASQARIYSTQKNGNIGVAVSASGKVAWSFSRSGRPVTAAPGKPQPQPQPTSGDPTVYITNTGECYHRDGCHYLSHSKIPIRLSAAKAQGYRPCSVCDPPQGRRDMGPEPRGTRPYAGQRHQNVPQHK